VRGACITKEHSTFYLGIDTGVCVYLVWEEKKSSAPRRPCWYQMEPLLVNPLFTFIFTGNILARRIRYKEGRRRPPSHCLLCSPPVLHPHHVWCRTYTSPTPLWSDTYPCPRHGCSTFPGPLPSVTRQSRSCWCSQGEKQRNVHPVMRGCLGAVLVTDRLLWRRGFYWLMASILCPYWSVASSARCPLVG